MKGFYLSKEELATLRKAHKAERNKSAAYKINAVLLLGSGWTLKQVKEALLLDEETSRNYVVSYKEGGIRKLVQTNYQGGLPRLDEQECEKLGEELAQNIYLTTQSIIEFVIKTFNKTYSQSGMRDLLHRMDYVYKKPKLVPGNPDHEAQELFEEQYAAFMRDKAEDVDVFFADAVHPEHNAQAAYGWMKRGEVRELKTNSGRQRLNLHGAIHAETHEVILLESDTIDSDSTVRLLETLEQKYFLSSEILVILDNAKYHYSKMVQDHLAEHPRIRLIYLPSYSPNLNLIERLWKFFKKKVLYNTYHETINAFRAAAIDFFSNISRYAEEIKYIMSGGFEINYT